jgi:hypothetical protein
MAIGIYARPTGMTKQNYDESIRRLEAAGAGKPKGRLFHSCFGEGDALAIYDVWESQADFDEFVKVLGPIMNDLGIDGSHSDVVPMHNWIIG